MGTGGPRAVGPRYPSSLPAASPARPTLSVRGRLLRPQLCPGAVGTPPAARPRREVPGFPLREEPAQRKPGVEGFRLHTCNSWMSQK